MENGLSPFSPGKSLIKKKMGSIYRTKDAKAVHARVLSKLSSGFVFSETPGMWNCFGVGSGLEEIRARQEFFSGLKVFDGALNGHDSGEPAFLKSLSIHWGVTPKQLTSTSRLSMSLRLLLNLGVL